MNGSSRTYLMGNGHALRLQVTPVLRTDSPERGKGYGTWYVLTSSKGGSLIDLEIYPNGRCANYLRIDRFMRCPRPIV